MHTFLIADGEKHWISAESADEALRIHAENYGYNTVAEWEKDFDEFEITKLPDEQLLDVGDFDDPTAPRVEKTCGEWAKLKPNQLVATTLY